MNESNVSICCAEKAFHAFRNAWNQTGLRPDKVLKDEGLYYIIWEDILWDDVLNAKVKPLFDLMECFDKTKVYMEKNKLMDSTAKTNFAPFWSRQSVKPPVEAPASKHILFLGEKLNASSAFLSLNPPLETYGIVLTLKSYSLDRSI